MHAYIQATCQRNKSVLLISDRNIKLILTSVCSRVRLFKLNVPATKLINDTLAVRTAPAAKAQLFIFKFEGISNAIKLCLKM